MVGLLLMTIYIVCYVRTAELGSSRNLNTQPQLKLKYKKDGADYKNGVKLMKHII